MLTSGALGGTVALAALPLVDAVLGSAGVRVALLCGVVNAVAGRVCRHWSLCISAIEHIYCYFSMQHLGR